MSGRPRIDEPIHVHFRVSASEVQRLVADQDLLQRTRLLLHEQAGGCYSSDPTVCYDAFHHPPINAAAFLRRQFGQGPRPADGKRNLAYDWPARGKGTISAAE